MNPWLPLLWLWLASVVMLGGGWWWQRRHCNATIVDAVWAAGVGLGALRETPMLIPRFHARRKQRADRAGS